MEYFGDALERDSKRHPETTGRASKRSLKKNVLWQLAPQNKNNKVKKGKQKNKQANKQTNNQTNKQTNKQSNKQTKEKKTNKTKQNKAKQNKTNKNK